MRKPGLFGDLFERPFGLNKQGFDAIQLHPQNLMMRSASNGLLKAPVKCRARYAQPPPQRVDIQTLQTFLADDPQRLRHPGIADRHEVR